MTRPRFKLLTSFLFGYPQRSFMSRAQYLNSFSYMLIYFNPDRVYFFWGEVKLEALFPAYSNISNFFLHTYFLCLRNCDGLELPKKNHLAVYQSRVSAV